MWDEEDDTTVGTIGTMNGRNSDNKKDGTSIAFTSKIGQPVGTNGFISNAGFADIIHHDRENLLTNHNSVRTHWEREKVQDKVNSEEVPISTTRYAIVDKHANFSVEEDDNIQHVKRERPQCWDLVGCVVKIDPRYVLFFSPTPNVWKVIVPQSKMSKSPFILEGNKLQLGLWMKIEAVPRHSQAYDILYPPRYSHIAIKPPIFCDIQKVFPSLEQRFLDGIFEVRLTFTIGVSEGYVKVGDDDRHDVFYQLPSTSPPDFVAIVPGHRMKPIFSNLSKPKTLRFWASRGIFMFNYCLHLYEKTEIEEILPDGYILKHFSPIFSKNQTEQSNVAKDNVLSSKIEHDHIYGSERGAEHEVPEFPAISSVINRTQIETEEMRADKIEIALCALLVLEEPVIKDAITASGLNDDYNKVVSIVKTVQEEAYHNSKARVP